MAETMLSTDRNGDGLVKYAASGNSGSWNEGLPKVRPSNWWDTIGFGYEDAYANALAYRALRAMGRMAGQAHQAGDSARYSRAAERLHDAYMKAFFDPATGILGGWRSADGALHDDAFVFVNGIAVLYGLVPPKDAPAIMDRIWRRISEAGYSNFRMGLPGNLVPVPRRDYAHKDPRYGGGMREDNLDGFQIYENGGATACFSYFTIAALDRVGAHDRADRVLFPILDAFEKREFEGTGSNGRTNDWRKWDGTAEGYEGFLTDNYYTLLAVVGRQDPASP
jgi:GH15 family glucan-1,4-alpha-glucosidase